MIWNIIHLQHRRQTSKDACERAAWGGIQTNHLGRHGLPRQSCFLRRLFLPLENRRQGAVEEASDNPIVSYDPFFPGIKWCERICGRHSKHRDANVDGVFGRESSKHICGMSRWNLLNIIISLGGQTVATTVAGYTWLHFIPTSYLHNHPIS